MFGNAIVRKYVHALARGTSRGLHASGPASRLRFTMAAIALAGGSLLAASASATPALTSTPAPLLVTTTSPLTATAGSAYVAKLDATGGVKPYSWSLAGGTSLPAGLVLHASTGQITGKAVGPAGTSDFIAEVTDSESSPVSATALESITVTVTPLTVTTVALPAATAGVAYSATLAAAGGVAPYSWSASRVHATSSASRVFPTPPRPTMLTSRTDGSATSRRTAASSASRPMSGADCTERRNPRRDCSFRADG